MGREIVGSSRRWFYTLPPPRLKDLMNIKGGQFNTQRRFFGVTSDRLLSPQSPHRLFPPLIWTGERKYNSKGFEGSDLVWILWVLLEWVEGGCLFPVLKFRPSAQARWGRKIKNRKDFYYLSSSKITDFITSQRPEFVSRDLQYWRGVTSITFPFWKKRLVDRSWVVFPILYFYQWTGITRRSCNSFPDKFLLSSHLSCEHHMTSPSHRDSG